MGTLPTRVKIRRHITLPESVVLLFNRYSAHQQMSLSRFVTEAGLQMIRAHGGDWKREVDVIENPDTEVVRAEEFKSMTREEKDRLWEKWR